MSASHHRLYSKLQRAAHAVNKAADRSLLGAANITTAQAAVMAVINADGSVTQKHIAKQLGINESAVTAMAKRLIKLDYITRTRCPDDGRAWQLDMTLAGRQAFANIAQPFAAINDVLDAQISPEDMSKLAEMLERISEAF